jgi:hypothetical protein
MTFVLLVPQETPWDVVSLFHFVTLFDCDLLKVENNNKNLA